jgi:hypothetical protein
MSKALCIIMQERCIIMHAGMPAVNENMAFIRGGGGPGIRNGVKRCREGLKI